VKNEKDLQKEIHNNKLGEKKEHKKQSDRKKRKVSIPPGRKGKAVKSRAPNSTFARNGKKAGKGRDKSFTVSGFQEKENFRDNVTRVVRKQRRSGLSENLEQVHQGANPAKEKQCAQIQRKKAERHSKGEKAKST